MITLNKKELLPEQRIAIGYLALPKELRPSLAKIARECGTTKKVIEEWKNDDFFLEQLKREMVKQTTDKLPDLLNKMPEIAIEQGNATMAKTFLQAHGLLTEQVHLMKQTEMATWDPEAIKKRLDEYKRNRKKMTEGPSTSDDTKE